MSERPEKAFAAFIEPHRSELHAHCRSMLRSADDADDVVQDTLLRAWRGLPRFEGRSSLRTWVYRIAINTSRDAVRSRSLAEQATARLDSVDQAVPDDPARTPEARCERREGVEEAIIAALRLLPPNQRSALILREVLGFSARETAEKRKTTVASVNSALQRARASIAARPPDRRRAHTLRSLGDDRLRGIVERCLDAWERDDVDAFVSLLAEESGSRDP